MHVLNYSVQKINLIKGKQIKTSTSIIKIELLKIKFF